MENITDVRIAMRCAEVLVRVKEYHDKARYNMDYVRPYVSQRRLYEHLKAKIHNEAIIEHLGELEKKLE